MKALMLSHIFPNPAADGYAATFILNRALHLKKYCEPTVVAPVPWVPPIGNFEAKYSHWRNAPRQHEYGGVKVYYPRYPLLPKRHLFSLWGYSYFRFALNMVRRIPFDVVYAHPLYPDGYAGLGVKRVLGKPLVVTIGGDVILQRMTASACLRSIARQILQGADAVITVGSYQKDICLKLGMGESSRIYNIPPGADTDVFYPMDEGEARKTLGLPPDKKIILCVCQLYAPKGLDYLISAFAQVYAMDHTFTLLIIGDGPLRESVEDHARELGVAGAVRLVGHVGHDQLAQWYNACHLFVLASTQEGFPTVIPEALACGKPVVATSVGGVPDVLSDSVCGIMVPPRDSEALADGIVKASQMTWDRDVIATRGRQYSWEELAGRIFRVFCEVDR